MKSVHAQKVSPTGQETSAYVLSDYRWDPLVAACKVMADLLRKPANRFFNDYKIIVAACILDMAMSGTTATLLARRWESAVLVNVDNATLKRPLNNPEAMRALMSIEGSRSLNSDIETIINKAEHVKNVKKSKAKTSLQKIKSNYQRKKRNARAKERKYRRNLSSLQPVSLYSCI